MAQNTMDFIIRGFLASAGILKMEPHACSETTWISYKNNMEGRQFTLQTGNAKALQHNTMHVYAEASLTVFNGMYSQENVCIGFQSWFKYDFFEIFSFAPIKGKYLSEYLFAQTVRFGGGMHNCPSQLEL